MEDDIITEADVYNFPAVSYANIACSGCGTIYKRKIHSIRVNIRTNGKFICHQCVLKTDKYLQNNKSVQPKKTGSKWDSDVIVNCCDCNTSYNIKYRHLQQLKRNNKLPRCRSCATRLAHKDGKHDHVSSPESIARLAAHSKKFWDNMRGKWRSEMAHIFDSQEHRELMSECGKRPWEDPDTRQYMLDMAQSPERRLLSSNISKKNWADPELRKMMSDGSREMWADPEFRDMMIAKFIEAQNRPEVKEATSARSKSLWEDPEYRQKMAVIRSNIPRESSIQLMLYKYLDDLGVLYHKEGTETVIGFYVFDCLIPHSPKNILIECQGDYWHSLEKKQSQDRSKFTYIDRYFPEYEIVYVWEHEFYTHGRVLDRLKLKLGLDVQTVDFDFADVKLDDNIPAKDVKSFLDAYHYIGKGRGGVVVGAYHNNELIAVSVFSPPLRQNMNIYGEFCELSRFCIHPSYHKRNFASWFLSRAVKYSKTSRIVAYSDSTVGHCGTIYQATNFRLDHEVQPDYWYADDKGYVMHKRTLYGKAKQMRTTEDEYAITNGYHKIYGGKKLCYIFDSH